MGMDIGVSFQYPMSMDAGMGVIFKNEYEYEYSLTRTEPASLPSLMMLLKKVGYQFNYTFIVENLHALFESHFSDVQL